MALMYCRFTLMCWFVCSDVGMCRICHEGGGSESLLSPCDCTGTLGKVHRSCLEKWLSSSNTSYCELCHAEFTIERRPQPLTQVSPAFSFSNVSFSVPVCVFKAKFYFHFQIVIILAPYEVHLKALLAVFSDGKGAIEIQFIYH